MNKIKYIWTLCAALVLMGFTACNDDNDSGCSSSSAITIDKVFLQNVKDKAHPDREVSFARLGQLVRIQGSGFTGLRHIYINGYDTYFNNALMTDNNVWVQLNSKTLVGDKADADARNKIVFVNDNGSYTYDFEVRAASPQITSFSTSLPPAGEKVIAYGTSLEEVSSITLPSGTVITDGIESDPDGEWFSFTMPANETVGGSLLFTGVNGQGKSPTYFNNNSCYIVNYDGLGTPSITGWSSGTGSYSSDELVDDPLETGRGKCVQLIPESVLSDGPLAAGLKCKGWGTNNVAEEEDWTRMTTTGFIEEDTPLNAVALQFDIYTPKPWNGSGQLQIAMINNLNSFGWGCADTQKDTKGEFVRITTVWVPWLDATTGKTEAFDTEGKWQTVTIPLTDFAEFSDYGKDDKTYTFKNLIALRNAATWKNFMLCFVNTNIVLTIGNDEKEVTLPASDFSDRIYIDNLRIVNTENFTVSDFDDAETE